MLSIFRQRALKHYLLKKVSLNSKAVATEDQTEFYFGYGANLSMQRFTSRNMNVSEVGNACLKDHEIRFSLSNEYKQKGYAGVHPSKGQEVWGVLYRIDPLSLKLLDTLEWCGFGAYERKLVEVRLDSGKLQKAWCYFVKHPKSDLYPSKIYLTNMIKAGKERGFPESYQKFIASHEYKENFEIDHGYSLLFYGQRRTLEKPLKPLYRVHDKLREKLCDLI